MVCFEAGVISFLVPFVISSGARFLFYCWLLDCIGKVLWTDWLRK